MERKIADGRFRRLIFGIVGFFMVVLLIFIFSYLVSAISEKFFNTDIENIYAQLLGSMFGSVFGVILTIRGTIYINDKQKQAEQRKKQKIFAAMLYDEIKKNLEGKQILIEELAVSAEKHNSLENELLKMLLVLEPRLNLDDIMTIKRYYSDLYVLEQKRKEYLQAQDIETKKRKRFNYIDTLSSIWDDGIEKDILKVLNKLKQISETEDFR